MKVLEGDAAQPPRGVLELLYDDRVDAILLHGLYDAATLSRLADRLEAERHRARPRDYADAARAQVEVIGEPISPSDRHPTGPDPDAYFDAAEGFITLCRELFHPAPSFLDRRRALLATLADADAQRLTVEGHAWGCATFRRVPPGSELTLHCENLYADIPVLAPARAVADLKRTLSCFMPIAQPETGGALCLYGRERPTELRQEATLTPAPGDLVIFAAGARYHRITPVAGARARWTIGGFMAPSPDDRELWIWG